MKSTRYIGIGIMACALLAGCGADKPVTGTLDAGEKQAAAAPANAVKSIPLLDGRVTVSIPEDLKEEVNQNGLIVFTSDDMGVTLGGITVPPGTAPAETLIQQTIDNLKAADPNLKMIKTGEFKIGEHTAKSVEADTVTNGKRVRLTTAIARFDDKMLSLQVVGARSDADAVSALAKSIYESVRISK